MNKRTSFINSGAHFTFASFQHFRLVDFCKEVPADNVSLIWHTLFDSVSCIYIHWCQIMGQTWYSSIIIIIRGSIVVGICLMFQMTGNTNKITCPFSRHYKSKIDPINIPHCVSYRSYCSAFAKETTISHFRKRPRPNSSLKDSISQTHIPRLQKN